MEDDLAQLMHGKFNSQMYDGRNWKCGPKRTEDGEKGLMNYGKRRSVWSRCTRRDFENYLNRVLQTKPDFCLKEFTGISKDNKKLKKYSSALKTLLCLCFSRAMLQ